MAIPVNEGACDLAVASYGMDFDPNDTGSIAVLIGNGDGTFQTAQTLTVAGLHPETVAAADLNGDGMLDLAAVFVSTANQPATLAVFVGRRKWMEPLFRVAESAQICTTARCAQCTKLPNRQPGDTRRRADFH